MPVSAMAGGYAASMARMSTDDGFVGGLRGRAPSGGPRRSAREVREAELAEASREVEAGREPTLEGLVRLQRASGRWTLDAALAEATGLDLARLRDLVSSNAALEGRGDVVATLAALVALRTRWADREDEWRLLAAKAESWLAREIGRGGEVELRKRLDDSLAAMLQEPERTSWRP